MKLEVVLGVLMAALCSACGGQTTDDRESKDVDSVDPDMNGAADAGAGDGGQQVDGGVALPGCQLGFDPEDADGRPCNWVAQGRCYEEKLEACACICPRDTAVTSNCSSGFPEENGHVPVYCQ